MICGACAERGMRALKCYEWNYIESVDGMKREMGGDERKNGQEFQVKWLNIVINDNDFVAFLVFCLYFYFN